MVIGWILLILGLLSRRLAGIEAMCVVQFSWLNIMCINNEFIQPFASVVPLKYSTGFNCMFFTDNSPHSLHSPFTSQFKMSSIVFANNFNISMILLVVLTLTVIIFFMRLNK
jgi:hypothetical protein